MRETIYLRFADRAAAMAALRPLDLLTVDPLVGAETIPSMVERLGERVDIDVLGGGSGILWRDTGAVVPDPETGEPLAVMTRVEGFHLDLLWSETTSPDFGDAEVRPATPARVFSA